VKPPEKWFLPIKAKANAPVSMVARQIGFVRYAAILSKMKNL